MASTVNKRRRHIWISYGLWARGLHVLRTTGAAIVYDKFHSRARACFQVNNRPYYKHVPSAVILDFAGAGEPLNY